jgi:septal ring factor EnvC (AmiA/AmiB activator)
VTFVGRPLNLALVVALLVLAAGTVGATVLYQSGVSEVEAQNEQLRTQNEQLREDLRSARDRIETLESEIESLEAEVADVQETLDARNETLASVREERDRYRADLQSVCKEWNQDNGEVPEECENVE